MRDWLSLEKPLIVRELRRQLDQRRSDFTRIVRDFTGPELPSAHVGHSGIGLFGEISFNPWLHFHLYLERRGFGEALILVGR